jgi:hypothetical protein
MKSYLKTLPLLLLVMSCSPGPKADRPLSPLVREAVTFLPLIREDADLRDEKTEDIALAMTRLGAPRAGWDLTSQMATPLRIATLYRLAVLSAKQGDSGSSQRAFATAEKGMEMYPLNPPRVPEIERAAAYAVLKPPAQARQKAERLGNAYDRNEAQAKVRAEEILRSPDPISLPNANVILPEITAAWCDQALKAGPEAGRPLLDKALVNSRDGFPVFRPRMLIECAAVEGKWGQASSQEALLREAGTIAAALGDRTESGPMERARVGKAMAKAGLKKAALETLQAAEIASRLPASYFQPPAMVMVAEGYWELGDKEKAEAIWTEAAKVALVHPHPNARAVNAIEVLLSVADYQEELPAGLRGILDQIQRGEGGEGSATLALSPEIQDAINRTRKDLNAAAVRRDQEVRAENAAKAKKEKGREKSKTPASKP